MEKTHKANRSTVHQPVLLVHDSAAAEDGEDGSEPVSTHSFTFLVLHLVTRDCINSWTTVIQNPRISGFQ